MIGRLRGILLEKHPPELLIEANGVAYEIQASMQTFYQLPECHHEIILHTHFVVREDAQQLYGFIHKEERSLFRALLKVNGVGPKSALAILSSVSPDEFMHSINIGDTASLVKLPGVGRKTAERLVIEMRDRLKELQHGASLAVSASLSGSSIKSSPYQDALSALVALGYKSPEAIKALQGIESQEMSSEEMIRQALKKINS
jgi:Holliday junction DNA helicase RuvA